jgi:REP element-mobilizing transposase RayT
MIYFNSGATVRKYRSSLPHWNQVENTYFVTFRLFDSLPISRLREIRQQILQWRKLNPEPLSQRQEEDYAKQFTRKIHRWLDAGHGACFLRRPSVHKEMEGILKFFEEQRYRLGEFMIMPNHVHVLVTPLMEHRLDSILHSWKSFSAKRINEICERTGKVWQHESFDHLVRSPEQLARIKTYIKNNPLIGRAQSASDMSLD